MIHFIKENVLAVGAVVIIIVFLIGSAFIAAKYDITHKWCSDFGSRTQAQAYFISKHALWLDSNNDGQACTSYRYTK